LEVQINVADPPDKEEPGSGVKRVGPAVTGLKAVYCASVKLQPPVRRYQRRTQTGLPLVGKLFSVVVRLVPSDPVSRRLNAPWVVPTWSHHSRTGVVLGVQTKVAVAPGNMPPGVGVKSAGSEELVCATLKVAVTVVA